MCFGAKIGLENAMHHTVVDTASAILGQGITNAAASISEALQGAKLQSSIASVKEAGGKDGYIDMSVAMARGKTAAEKSMLESYPDEESYVAAQRREGTRKGIGDYVKNIQAVAPEQIENTIKTILNNPRLSDEERESVKNSLIKSNLIDKEGKINYDPENYIRAMATYKAGSQTDDARVTIGGVTHSLDRDIIANTTRISTDASEVHHTGDGINYHNGLSGNVKQAMIEKATGANLAHLGKDADGNEASGAKLVAEYVGAALIAGATVNGISKKYTGKGIIDNVKSATHKLRGNLDEALDNPDNHQNGNNANSTPNKTDKIVHNKTPSINDYLTGNYNKKSAQTKSWSKEIGKSFLKTKAGKLIGGAAAVVGLSSLAGAAEEGYEGYMGDNHTTVPPQSADTSMSTTDAAVILGTSAVVNGATAMYGAAELKAAQQTTGKLLAKEGSKFAGKAASKLMPGVGLAFGIKYAADEFEKGNYGRATFEMLSGVASLVPGIGTLASAAIDMGLATESVLNPEQETERLSRIANSKSELVGTAALGALATSNQRTVEHQIAGDHVIRKLRKGEAITRDELIATGADPQVVNTLPLSENGTIDQMNVNKYLL